ncbi:hypothetical protein HDU67_004671 [Dinochytrium kinnereticum]|nr:hypothetical protein HDU67_004671 [Dinochytrium kinnereticum]
MLDNAPVEIGLHVLSWLSPKDLAVASSVCRRWRNLCNEEELWRNLCNERWSRKQNSPLLPHPLIDFTGSPNLLSSLSVDDMLCILRRRGLIDFSKAIRVMRAYVETEEGPSLHSVLTGRGGNLVAGVGLEGVSSGLAFGEVESRRGLGELVVDEMEVDEEEGDGGVGAMVDVAVDERDFQKAGDDDEAAEDGEEVDLSTDLPGVTGPESDSQCSDGGGDGDEDGERSHSKRASESQRWYRRARKAAGNKRLRIEDLRLLVLRSLPDHVSKTMRGVAWSSLWRASFASAEVDGTRTRIVSEDLFDRDWDYLPCWMDGVGIVRFRRNGKRWCSMWGPPQAWVLRSDGSVQVQKYPPYKTLRTLDWGWVLSSSWCEYRTRAFGAPRALTQPPAAFTGWSMFGGGWGAPANGTGLE